MLKRNPTARELIEALLKSKNIDEPVYFVCGEGNLVLLNVEVQEFIVPGNVLNFYLEAKDDQKRKDQSV